MKNLMGKLGGRGHIVTTDNYFTSIPLFLDLLSNGTMAISILRGNKKYVPRAMLSYKKKGNWLDRLQNASRNKSILCGLKDKQPVVLLSTHADAVPSQGNGNLYGANLGAIGRKSI